MNKILVFCLLMLCQLIFNFAMSIISPFFPPFAKDKGIEEFTVGIIFSANPVGAVLGSVLLGKFQTNVYEPIYVQDNRIKIMLSALLLQAIGLFCFIGTYYVDSNTWIIIIALGARFINGLAVSFFMTPMYAYIPILFPERVQQMISYAEIITALGFLLGPMVGSIIYGFGGYIMPFIFFGTISVVLVPIIYYILKEQHKTEIQPTTLDESPAKSIKVEFLAQTPEKSTPEADLDKVPLTYSEVLNSYVVVVTSLGGFVVNFMFTYFSPIQANYYETQYNISVENIGYIICIPAVTYTLVSLVVGHAKSGQAYLIFTGSLVVAAGSILTGPNKYVTGLNPHLYYTLPGFGLLGAGASPMYIFYLYNSYICLIPMLNIHLVAKFPKQPTQCSNMASALLVSVTYLGELVAPPISGFMVQHYSFETAGLFLAIFMLGFAALYFPVLFMKVPQAAQKSTSFRGSALKNRYSLFSSVLDGAH